MMASTQNHEKGQLERIVDSLCHQGPGSVLFHRHRHEVPMPSVAALEDIIDGLRAVLFPGYFGHSDLTPQNLRYHVGAGLDRTLGLLAEQIKRGYCFYCSAAELTCSECDARAMRITDEFASRLPVVQALLSTDVQAAFVGDPAARHPGETVFCYPSITAMTHYRIAHELQHLGVPLIPRMITEFSHSRTGIDIHPGAHIGESFFMDHGTGIVIGETTIIGANVRLYQGVTLGAKSFPVDEQGNPLKGMPRHPIVEDDVTIYAGATILGRITIGRGAVIGGNVWVTSSVPPAATITQGRPVMTGYLDGDGI
ncbi:MAG: serine acetyltransferase [Deltaproteobacteria bacterium HGW-Deltaproteobacteria-17]|nr:MAG: serine acetyltransferase [Deltaproteobacteria bacterium HGW-Deltaproteobacteria-17]